MLRHMKKKNLYLINQRDFAVLLVLIIALVMVYITKYGTLGPDEVLMLQEAI